MGQDDLQAGSPIPQRASQVSFLEKEVVGKSHALGRAQLSHSELTKSPLRPRAFPGPRVQLAVPSSDYLAFPECSRTQNMHLFS